MRAMNSVGIDRDDDATAESVSATASGVNSIVSSDSLERGRNCA
jgi:hypothetical protein